jgi:hypothetical protein
MALPLERRVRATVVGEDDSADDARHAVEDVPDLPV